ncbi:hypothetical protein Gogos_021256 [Gossypium gossypioides]|uniref:DUF7745 domain-containing protein n=1 Tax=Gossypium gossypioides TaxID=34282 RepID=A0A7J9D599_GOSGO|nr:hypothetical protein [Gossypium gossypioides]
MKKRVDVFALSIYGLVIFPKALGHIDDAVSGLFDRLDKRVTPIPIILAQTFRSLSACQRAGEGRFIECAQLLLAFTRDIGSYWICFSTCIKAIWVEVIYFGNVRLAQCKFVYKGNNYKKKVCGISKT